NYLIESIDETVEPCEDFFQFACGTWVKNTRIPDDVSAQTTFNLLRTQLDYNVIDLLSSPPVNNVNEPKAVLNARRFYNSCIDEDEVEANGVDTILSLINTEFGGWPILQGSSWNSAKFDLPNLLFQLRKYYSNTIYRIDTAFDFTDYLRRCYLSGNVILQDTDIVAVGELEYLTNVSLILKQASPRTIQNYILWRFMMGATSLMPQHIRMIRQRFDRIFRGTNAERPRKVACGSLVNAYMGFAVSKLYIKKYFDENALNESLEMINNIRDVFIEMLDKSTWMDAESKEKAIEKAKVMDPHIGYPEYLGSDNNTKLEEDYAEADGNLTQGEDIADNGGLREAFFAYQKWTANNKNVDKRLPGLQKYSSEQLFFINYANNWCVKMTDAYALNRLRTDVHSLGHLRVIVPTSNFDEFDRAFGCTPGQGNSRKDKCIVW
ncbi:unnamed protein product, partial [Rotaria sp. Silwood2]